MFLFFFQSWPQMLQAEADEVLHHLASDYRLMLGSVAHWFSLVVQLFVVGKSNISVSVQCLVSWKWLQPGLWRGRWTSEDELWSCFRKRRSDTAELRSLVLGIVQSLSKIVKIVWMIIIKIDCNFVQDEDADKLNTAKADFDKKSQTLR